jgi:hypothetical protein
MATDETRISEYTPLAVAPASGDLFEVVDISDLTDAPSGTSKKIAASVLGLDVPIRYVVDAGAVNAISITHPNSPTNWTNLVGVPIAVKIAVSNTSAVTFAVVGLTGTKPVRKKNSTALVSGDLNAADIYWFVYDGTYMQCRLFADPTVFTAAAGVARIVQNGVELFSGASDTVIKDGGGQILIQYDGTNNCPALMTGLPIYANNAAALSAQLVAGDIYRTSTGQLMIVY